MAGPDQAANVRPEVLPQSGKLSKCPIRMAAGGAAMAAILAYVTLYANKKPEASAADVAKVTVGAGTMGNTHPRK